MKGRDDDFDVDDNVDEDVDDDLVGQVQGGSASDIAGLVNSSHQYGHS